MSLINYNDVVPWARSIQKRVSERTMPPWFADPRYGKFQNERRLSESEIDTIVKWVSSGAHQGNSSDLPPAPQYVDGWTIGTPDAVFRTAEGLGVGSPLAAFDTAYGRGEAVGEEGNSVRYWPPDGGGHFFVDVSGGCYGMVARRWVVDRACRATDISFVVFARP